MEVLLVARTPSNGSPELRLAVANLLRLAWEDLADARLLLREGELRNAAVIGNQCLNHLVLALAASEHGWPLGTWKADLRSLPDANPLLGELTAIDGSITDALEPQVLADGGSASAPGTVPVHEVLDRLAAALGELGRAFGVDRDSTRPAERVHALRPAPPEPEAEPSGQTPAPRTREAERRARVQGRPQEAEDAPQPETDPEPAQPRTPAASSTAFWSLMDRWKVPDLDALRLVGHPGGLTKAGTRPRFKLVGAEAEILGYLNELDTSLRTLGLDPAAWLGKAVREAPFKGATPLAHISRNGVEGARDVTRRVMETGLQQARDARGTPDSSLIPPDRR